MDWYGGGPAPTPELAEDMVFDLPDGILTIGAFKERLLATEPQRRLAYGVGPTRWCQLYEMKRRSSGVYVVHFSYDEEEEGEGGG